MQDIAQNSRRWRIYWCPQPLLVSASRVQLVSPSNQPWHCSSVLDFLLPTPQKFEPTPCSTFPVACIFRIHLPHLHHHKIDKKKYIYIYIYIYILFYFFYKGMGFRGRGNMMNVLQPLVVYSFVSHWSPLFLWLEHVPIDCSLVRALSRRLFSFSC